MILACSMCNGVINKLNTKGDRAYNKKAICGKCYLKWKKEQRRKNSEG